MTATVPDRLPLRALWRPGLGLALWPAEPFDKLRERAERRSPAEPVEASAPPPLSELVDLPGAVADLLARRRLRHTVDLRGPLGARELRPTTSIGVPTAVELLDRCEHLRTGGDVAFYRYLLSGVRHFIRSGSVAPGMRMLDGESSLQWFPMPTAAWRGWLTVVTASAPESLAANGGDAALAD
ncbi:MAG: ATP-dependent helicase, partial [Gordonia sp. (in: high G+C Gram-positive bacteria)]